MISLAFSPGAVFSWRSVRPADPGEALFRRLRSAPEEGLRSVLAMATPYAQLPLFSRGPDAPAQRLASLCIGIGTVLGDPDAEIDLRFTASGVCPAGLTETVLGVAYELVGNAFQHGMHVRLLGRIEVTLQQQEGGSTVLTVRDDGWGCVDDPAPGEGLGHAMALLRPFGGGVRVQRRGGRTVATAVMHHSWRRAP